MQPCSLDFPGGAAVRIPLSEQDTQETWAQSLGREDPLEEEISTHSTILAWEIPWTKDKGPYNQKGCKELDMTKHAHMHTHILKKFRV